MQTICSVPLVYVSAFMPGAPRLPAARQASRKKNADYQLFFPNTELQVLHVDYYTGFICFNI